MKSQHNSKWSTGHIEIEYMTSSLFHLLFVTNNLHCTLRQVDLCRHEPTFVNAMKRVVNTRVVYKVYKNISYSDKVSFSTARQ
jgi:hypothetical protein